MEIGVYNGDNAVNIIEAAAQNYHPIEVEYYGFDFFSCYSPRQVGRKLEETGCRYIPRLVTWDWIIVSLSCMATFSWSSNLFLVCNYVLKVFFWYVITHLIWVGGA